jgi:hypothetical protein
VAPCIGVAGGTVLPWIGGAAGIVLPWTPLLGLKGVIPGGCGVAGITGCTGVGATVGLTWAAHAILTAVPKTMRRAFIFIIINFSIYSVTHPGANRLVGESLTIPGAKCKSPQCPSACCNGLIGWKL